MYGNFFQILKHCPAPYNRFIMTSSINFEKVMQSLKSNPFFDKYSDKITKLEKTAPEKIMDRWDKYTKKIKNEGNENEKSAIASFATTLTPGIAKREGNVQFAKKRNLNSILKMDLIQDKDVDEIEDIWGGFHKTIDFTVSAVIPSGIYKLIEERAMKYPMFVLPLPRDRGYEFILLQFANNEVHFTPLISYQTHKENAPECLTIAYYAELSNEKGVVLMRGEYDKNTITVADAQCLANQLQLYYGEKDTKRTNLLERFTNNTSDFRYMDLIAEIEYLSF